MRFDDFSKRISDFNQSVTDLDQISYSGVVIHVFDNRDYLRLMIEVRDETTHQDLRDAIPLAIKWRDRLIDWQGKTEDIYKDQVLSRLHQKNKLGQSYKEIADETNQKVFEYLLECKKFSKELKEVELPKYKTEMKFQLWKGSLYGYSFERAWNLLEVFGFNNEKIVEIINDGFDHINRGKSSFIINYPITKDGMRNTLRNWREKKN